MQLSRFGVMLSMIMLGPGISPSVPAAAQADNNPAQQHDERIDLHTFSNPGQVVVSHLDLDLTVDFEHRQLKGIAILDFRRQPGCPPDAPLALDTRELTVDSVGARDAGAPATTPYSPARFEVGRSDPILGSRLAIALPPGATQVRIVYRTEPSATALQWLEPALTAGKQRPFLFTQSQAIHARSWIPLQD